jgi:hypothetical protein
VSHCGASARAGWLVCSARAARRTPGTCATRDGAGSVRSHNILTHRQCPFDGWRIKLDDLTLPFWSWVNIEQFWVDANFFYGS